MRNLVVTMRYLTMRRRESLMVGQGKFRFFTKIYLPVTTRNLTVTMRYLTVRRRGSLLVG